MTEPTLCVDRLTPAIGARIEGVDLSGVCSATLLNRLYELLLEHLVLFVPEQTLTPATLLAFAETFGELDTPHHVYPHVPGYERVVLLENDEDRPPNTDVWHTDLTFKQNGCIGKKGATYAAFFRGVTNVWGVSRSWIAAAC